ncbi:MAG: HEPN domain-containing protein [Nanoarchaeota archaeon]|nr:HEPN domain-containing protein [Nanoarchaeota archaeon]MBU1321681.1 HEPN domain-containing protein [Nanoarchaeota archaeon]MBU1598078.1 HEPN domain-containing protein [Nanoarchaeota archaeon]MBU2441630.1 HEPN domain-containing protein [Nanoarchaeota archaeon]
MEFDKEFYEKEFEKLLKKKEGKKFYIKNSSSTFKINKFVRKGTDSLELANLIKDSDKTAKDYWAITICYYSMLYIAKAAILTKGYETDDHYATQIALGHLLVPNEIEKEDLELLEQAHKIFEDDYIEYFEDARKESSISRYSATKVYTERRVKEIFENARKFISRIRIILNK